MSSYYNKIYGTLKAGRTARAEDIHSIQASIQDALKNVVMDMFGTGFILGEGQNDLKLYPTNNYIDQENTNFNSESYWISFLDTYLRQPIDITKSSIKTITVPMKNTSVYDVTVYAEIRDARFDIVAETNAILRSKQGKEGKEAYEDVCQEIDFNFEKDHLPLGRYFFVIRPVDISATDLVMNGDETYGETIHAQNFCVKYDDNGTYNQGLEASYNGTVYLDSSQLEIFSNRNFENEHNFDLCFTHKFSSGNTYLVTDGYAMVLGEKVYPLDTHVSIDGPSSEGDRTDLVYLTTDGRLNVLPGVAYEDKKIYPTEDTGLTIAYVTTYKESTSGKLLPSIEQSDENNITRQRDILERLRRLEKKVDYQTKYNSPTRIKYNCTVDPVLAIDSQDDNIEVRGEGSYNISSGINQDGDTVITDNTALTYAWSIIDKNYKYDGSVQSTKDCMLTVWDICMPVTKPQDYSIDNEGMRYYAIVVDENQQPIPNLTLNIEIRQSGKTIHAYDTKKTDKDGVIKFALFALTLKAGTYNVVTSYNDTKIKSLLTVYNDANPPTNKTIKTYKDALTIFTTLSGDVTYTLPDNVFPGDDSFYADNVEVDTEKGEVRVRQISNTDKEYTINEDRPLLKDSKTFSSDEYSYIIKSDKQSLTSEYPVLHLTFKRDTYIKSITPYISKFKNISSFGILIFENNTILNMIQPTRQNVKKVIGNNNDVVDDAAYPTVFRSGYKSLEDLVVQSGNYKAPKTPIEFNVETKLPAGTYSLMIFAQLEDGQTEGEIKIKEYTTLEETSKYGIATKSVGSSQLSVIYMNPSNLTNRSWDVAIKQKVYDFYDTGVLISKVIDTKLPIKACNISKNIVVPNGCSLKLYVTNNGGATWYDANNGQVTFEGDNTNFQWKLEMFATPSATPKLVFNKNKNHAISFTLATTANYVEYEDYHRCYETPLLNANTITRFYGGSQTVNRFSEWEFARIFMEDEKMNSDIDILLSYNDEDYSTQVDTKKDDWHNKTFFRTVFAGLKLSDFSRDSVDYDNYDNNIEYDEYNYPFKLDSDYTASSAGTVALASPSAYYNENSSYRYGNINLDPSNITTNFTSYTYIDNDYSYIGNEMDETNKYAGMHITAGPYYKTELRQDNPTYTSNDSIIGITFPNGLKLNPNYTHLNIGVVAITGNDRVSFPPNTFKVVVSLNQYGESGVNTGIEQEIETELISGEYTEVSVNFADNLEGISTSGIGSIGIKAVNPKDADGKRMVKGDSIGIGRISTGSYNIRPYIPYSYSGSDERLKWEKIKESNDDLQAYGMCTIDKQENTDRAIGDVNGHYLFYYPISKEDIDQSQRTINNFSDNLNGSKLQIWAREGTSRKRLSGFEGQSLIRQGNKIKTTIKEGNNNIVCVSNSDVGNQTMFDLPENLTGELFKINVDIPYTTYNFIQIEYYMFCQFYDGNDDTEAVNSLNSDIPQKNEYLNIQNYNDKVYRTDGSFSKGEIVIEFYDTRDIDKASPVESFVLPSWGRIATRAQIQDKCVSAIFKKRSNAVSIKTVVLRRENPRSEEHVPHIKLCLNNIVLLNAHSEPALGPQMQMRIYPDNKNISNNTKIRKIGGIYRL